MLHFLVSKQILSHAINSVELDEEGFYRAECFRPTTANAAIQAGCNSDRAMYFGKWTTREMFFNHYIYPTAPNA